MTRVITLALLFNFATGFTHTGLPALRPTLPAFTNPHVPEEPRNRHWRRRAARNGQ